MGKIFNKLIHLYQEIKKEKTVPILVPADSQQLLQGKVALITGGSGGIGKAIAAQFVKNGCQVVITGRDELNLKACADEIGKNCAWITIDITKTSALCNKVREAADIFGRIDILVNSAGVHSEKEQQSFLGMTENEYDTIMTVNLKGTYFMCQEVAKWMVENEIKGHILNISSSTANEPAWSAYRLSKRGVLGLTEGIALELLKYGITVNSIAPGPTATKMLGIEEGDSIFTRDNQIRRLIMPEEIAAYAVMFASDYGNMVAGETLFISGGRGVFDIR